MPYAVQYRNPLNPARHTDTFWHTSPDLYTSQNTALAAALKLEESGCETQILLLATQDIAACANCARFYIRTRIDRIYCSNLCGVTARNRNKRKLKQRMHLPITAKDI